MDIKQAQQNIDEAQAKTRAGWENSSSIKQPDPNLSFGKFNNKTHDGN